MSSLEAAVKFGGFVVGVVFTQLDLLGYLTRYAVRAAG